MHQQELQFSQNTIQTVNIYRDAPKTESKTEGAQVKLTPTQKQAVQSFCKENGIGVSTFISHAIDSYFTVLPYLEKIKKYKKTIYAMLDNLP